MTHEQLETQGATLLLGAPGSGKTQALLEAATAFIEQGKDPARLLVLTPSRVSATRFREALSARITATVSTAPVRAWQAYAFDLLRRAHIEGYLPHLDFTPKLLSGPEQDVLIKNFSTATAAAKALALSGPMTSVKPLKPAVSATRCETSSTAWPNTTSQPQQLQT